ncbi:hypothetical protein G6F56_003490 [Rhizopus delemar]|uniref:BHLH domain-containing protein n=1 Tax=Rhizopus stolonifer TaxID=4846 RepID=A0A367KQB4_RHIST|nr:hypothetical protein G6F56_003490 [Rhizopus delemar]RCI04386.1 hypothetical protein CU098_009281 [Rhizopus stolonifer]
MTETTFKLKNPTEYHLQQQLSLDDFNNQPPPSFMSPLISDFDEFDVKNRMMDMDFMSEESPSDYSSVLSNSRPQSFLLDVHQEFNSNELLSVSPQSPLLFSRQPFSAPAHTSYLSTLNNTDVESLQMQQQIMTEKRRKRRESHNAVERRRRENINERIQELGTMLPESMLEEITVQVGNNMKPNKGAILRKSVDQIRLMQQQVIDYKKRIQELESQLGFI